MQSPLSLVINELEEDLDVRLFIPNSRSTRPSRAGKIFKENVPRIFTALQQAREGAQAVAAGYDGQLITLPRLSAFLANCRDDDPEIGIHPAEIPLSQQIERLRADLYDAGLAQFDDGGDGLLIVPAWHDPLVVAVPAKYPLLPTSASRWKWDMGPDAPTANAAKIACNMMITMAIEAMAEAVVLTEANGLARERFLDLILNTLFGSRSYQVYSENIRRNRYEPGFKASLGLKDLRLAQEAAAQLGRSLPMLDAVRQQMARAVAQGSGDKDWSVMADCTIRSLD